MLGVMLFGSRSDVVFALHEAACSHEPPVLFIDSANCFDPHILHGLYRDDAYEVMENILITRPFTAFQLLAALKQTSKLIESHQRLGMLVIISSLDCLFDDVTGRDRSRLLSGIEEEVHHMMARFRTKFIVGRHRPSLSTNIKLAKVVIDGSHDVAAAQHSPAPHRRAQEVQEGVAQGGQGTF